MTPLPGISEKAFQDQVVQLARLNGWLVFHPLEMRGSAHGWPDLTLVRGVELLFVELKSETGRVRPEQEMWLASLRLVADAVASTALALQRVTGGDLPLAAYPPPVVEVHVLRPSDFDAIQARLGRRASPARSKETV